MSEAYDEPNGYASYDNTHRAFLQALLAHQSITLPEAKPILSSILTAHTSDRTTLEEDVSPEDFENYIHTLNASISPFDLEIRSTLHQVTRERTWALVNVASDALTQMSTTFSADEIAFIKRVLDAMFETYNTPRAEIMAITSIQAVRYAKHSSSDPSRRDSGTQSTQLQSSTTGLSVHQAEKVLEFLEHESWFERSKRGYYTLTPRALMELRTWLVETYNSTDDDSDAEEEPHVKIKMCQACKEIVTVGQRCPNVVCEARAHEHCLRNLWRSQGDREDCPICKTGWVEGPPVGERAARGGGENLHFSLS
ncbi:DNA repair protein Nse1 [Teratosphaeria nubilosa]|uniref:Non-structural maintenance of chromosomes element 1 homolog n=1 Tax=Teratosphaeria nubilosa TaxID=161662 RepID=A0A6G1L0K7_9PEZI|nr:DNA repair protein Nse1 [Teratosphaeria nubilosa]